MRTSQWRGAHNGTSQSSHVDAQPVEAPAKGPTRLGNWALGVQHCRAGVLVALLAHKGHTHVHL
jgi:hypothetical protein